VVWFLGILLVKAAQRPPGLRGQRARGETAVSVIVLLAVAFGVFQLVAVGLGKTGQSGPRTTGIVHEAFENSALLSPAHYAAGGISAFGHLYDQGIDLWPPARGTVELRGAYDPQTWGSATANSLGFLLPSVQQWEEVAPFVYAPLKTNVYTYIEPWYRDFRELGVLFGALIIGFLCIRSISAVSALGGLAGGLVLGLTAFAVFVNFFTSAIVVTQFAVILTLAVWNKLLIKGPSE